MADDIKLVIDVDKKGVLSAIKSTETLEAKVKKLSSTYASGAISYGRYNKGLDQLSKSTKKGKDELLAYGTALRAADKESKKAAAAAKEEAKAVKAYSLARRQATEEDRRRDAVVKSNIAALNQQRVAYQANTKELYRIRMATDSVFAAEQKLLKLKKLLRTEVANGNMTMRQAATTQMQYKKSLNGLSNGIHHAKRGTNQLGVMMQQTGYQVGDFAVQVGSGQSAMVAFGQQATQLIGTMAMFAKTTKMIALFSGLGILVPIISGLGAAFLRSSGGAKTLTQSVSELESATQSFTNFLETYTLGGLLNLEKKYGDVNGKVLELIESQKFLAEVQLNKSLKDTIGLIGEITGARWYDIGITDYASSVLNLRDTFKTTKADAEVLYEAFEDIGKAEVGSLEQADALARASDHMKALISTSDNVTEEQLKLLKSVLDTEDAIRQMVGAAPSSNWMNPAITGVSNLYKKAVEALAKIIALKKEAGLGGARPKGRPDDIDFGYTPDPAGGTRPQGRPLDFMAPPKTRDGGGGSKESPQDKFAKYLADKEKELELETKLVGIFGAERDIQSELFKARDKYSGVITEDQATELEGTLRLIEAEKQRQEALEEAKEQQEALAETISGAMGDAFMSIIDGTKSAGDAFKDMARLIISELIKILVIEKMVKSISGAISGAFGGGVSTNAISGPMTSSLRPPKMFADGGVVTRATGFGMSGGGSGVMGEAGPEAIMPLKRGKNGKLGVQMEGGSTTTVVQNFNFQANGDDSVKRLIAQAAPKIAQMTKSSMLDDRRRGGSTKAAFG